MIKHAESTEWKLVSGTVANPPQSVYVARQPILNRAQKIYGYELLYRSCPINEFDGTEGSSATLRVLSASLIAFGLDQLLGGALGFVNFPRDLLIDDVTLLLPPESIVIEILETVEPNHWIVAACRRLQTAGFRLALDDILPDTPSLALADYAHVIKVDYRATTPEDRRSLIKKYRRPGLLMLAERVETQDEFFDAHREGFDLFQGFFFTRPVVLSKRQIPGLKVNYLRLLSEVHRPTFDFEQIERLIKQEASLCHRLLRYINSAAFSRRNPTHSIREAILLLGEQDLRRWVSLAALPALASDKPDELVTTAVMRAHFCEAIAPRVGLGSRTSEMFLLGMFSLLDVMVGRPMDEVLDQVGVDGDLRAALLGALPPEDPWSQVHELLIACEQGQWETVAEIGDGLNLEPAEVPQLYLDAVRCEREESASLGR